MQRQKFIKSPEVEMMCRFGQVFMGAWLMGLLAVPAMTKAPTAEADSQSGVTAFQPSGDHPSGHTRVHRLVDEGLAQELVLVAMPLLSPKRLPLEQTRELKFPTACFFNSNQLQQ